MRQLDPKDLSWAVRMLPKQLIELMQEAGDRVVLGGGFVRSSVSGERPNDIDLFCKSKEDACSYATQLAGKKKVYETGNTYSVHRVGGYFVQFIHRWTYDNPAQILDSFDFTIACSAVWFENDGVSYELGSGGSIHKHPSQWKSLVDNDFYSDLTAKRLVYRSPQRNEDAGGSLLRVLRFVKRGFNISPEDFAAVMSRVTTAAYPFIQDIGNTETAWTGKITHYLREVDPVR